MVFDVDYSWWAIIKVMEKMQESTEDISNDEQLMVSGQFIN